MLHDLGLTLSRMLRGRWLGRRRWFWLADLVVVGAAIVLLIVNDDALGRLAMALLIVSRVLTAAAVVLPWYRNRDRTTPGSSRDAVAPPS